MVGPIVQKNRSNGDVTQRSRLRLPLDPDGHCKPKSV
jgi:hypothetical protein